VTGNVLQGPEGCAASDTIASLGGDEFRGGCCLDGLHDGASDAHASRKGWGAPFFFPLPIATFPLSLWGTSTLSVGGDEKASASWQDPAAGRERNPENVASRAFFMSAAGDPFACYAPGIWPARKPGGSRLPREEDGVLGPAFATDAIGFGGASHAPRRNNRSGRCSSQRSSRWRAGGRGWLARTHQVRLCRDWGPAGGAWFWARRPSFIFSRGRGKQLTTFHVGARSLGSWDQGRSRGCSGSASVTGGQPLAVLRWNLSGNSLKGAVVRWGTGSCTASGRHGDPPARCASEIQR